MFPPKFGPFSLSYSIFFYDSAAELKCAVVFAIYTTGLLNMFEALRLLFESVDFWGLPLYTGVPTRDGSFGPG